MGVQSVGDRRLFKLFWWMVGCFGYIWMNWRNDFRVKGPTQSKMVRGMEDVLMLCFRADFSIVPQLFVSLQSTISYIYIGGHGANFNV